ncbi:MAG: hypothetical protein ABR584_03580 [Candidatus Baltobacteraceae bacterium]
MGFLSLDGTFWLQLINFVIFFAILNVVFLKPVGRALAKRRAYIDSLTADYDAANDEFYRLQREMEGKRAAARRDAEATLAKARATASNETAEISTDFSARAQSVVEKARQTVAAELQAAHANEDATVRELASMMVDRIFADEARA